MKKTSWYIITQLVVSHFTKMTTPQSRHWCFTINNWTREDVEQLEALGPQVSYLVIGYETGDSGTPHIQGYVVFPRIKRRREALRLISPRAHLEVKRGTPQQAADYCKKDGLFNEWGELPSSTGRSPFDRFREWAVQHYQETGNVPTDREIANEFPALFVRYRRNLQDLARLVNPEPVLEQGQLRDWQEDLLEQILGPADDRTIIFVVDEDGGQGKTWLQRYLLTSHGDKVQVLSSAKRDDVAHAIDESKSIFLFNVPRHGMEYFSYTVVEQLKDRMVFSPKYDSRMKIFRNQPHVVVFSNEEPDMGKMSRDRYKIIKLE